MNVSRARGIGMTSQRTRDRMVMRLREQGIRDEGVLAAMAAVPRHLFVEEALASKAGRHFETASRIARELVERFLNAPPADPVLLNVNVPDVAYEDLGGLEVTRLGKRHRAEPVIGTDNPRGETVYWIGAAGGAQDAGPGTDFYAVSANRVSLTPLQMDLTHQQQIPMVRDWIESRR